MIQVGLLISAFVFFTQSLPNLIQIRNAVKAVPRAKTVFVTDTTVRVTGIVTLSSARTDSSLQTFIQDGSGGIRLYQYNYGGPSLFAGDSITAVGKLAIYYGQEEIENPAITLLRHGVNVSPLTATAKDISSGRLHGLLITCEGKIIKRIRHGSGVTYSFVDQHNDTATAFADFSLDPQFESTLAKVGESYSMTGVSTRYSYRRPYTDHDDLLLRSSADMRPLEGGFLSRHIGLMELIASTVLAAILALILMTFALRGKVRQKTSWLEKQSQVLKIFFDAVAELTGLLDKEAILTLALKKALELIGTRCVIFGDSVSSEFGFLLMSFELKDGQLSTDTRQFNRDASSPLLGMLSGRDVIWETTVDKVIKDANASSEDALAQFLETHIKDRSITILGPSLPKRDFLVAFDHAGPIPRYLPRTIIMSYVLHAYSAYKSAELFDVVREQSSALERLYNNSVFGLMTLSVDGTIQTANRIAMHMFDDEDLMGKKLQGFMVPHDSGRLNDLLSSLSAVYKEKFVRFTAGVENGQGQRRFEFAIQSDPALQTYYTTVQDTGELEYYEDYATNEKKIETLGRLASSLTHDLNNMVGSITGYASLLKRKLQRDTKEYHYADIIESSSRRTIELIREVLGFAQLDSKSLDVVDLNEFVSEVTADFRKTLGDKYSILFKPFDRPLHVRVSTTQIRQVLFSVLTNAADAMENGGTIVCTTGSAGMPDSAPAHVMPGEFNFVEVEDHGVGMDETIRRRIFEPFFTTKKIKKYTGLSLSMAYNILKHHKGFISVESAAGVGTRIKMNFPNFVQRAERQYDSAGGNRVNARGAKILVADDEEGVRQLACDILTDHGYVVVTANDGLQAIERLDQNPDVKLVVLDMLMPGMGGRDACVEIKKRPGAPKVLICTGYSDLADLESILGKYAEGLIQKPYAAGDMVRAVDNLISSSLNSANQ